MRILLAGNPNSGKSSLFNVLTGLHQRIGNYPGVTVEQLSGTMRLPNDRTAEVVDLPGIYSLFPETEDEQVAFRMLMAQVLGKTGHDHPVRVVVVADASSLRRNLLLITQLSDLNVPCVLVLNKADMAGKAGIHIDVPALSAALGMPVVTTNARTGEGVDTLKQVLMQPVQPHRYPWYSDSDAVQQALAQLADTEGRPPEYRDFVSLMCYDCLPDSCGDWADKCRKLSVALVPDRGKCRAAETVRRYARIAGLMKHFRRDAGAVNRKAASAQIDRFLMHPVGGYALLFGLLFLIFQAIFSWATLPMELIEALFGFLGGVAADALPQGWFSRLLVDGLLAGLGGVLVFIPQIALLFFFLGILEESGYMSRVSFLTDRLMRAVGLNGRSVMPLIGGFACAVPSIMATRSINNRKERLLTILVLPLMSCSARLPVYTLLISICVPPQPNWGIFNVQGMVLMGLYLLGLLTAICAALVLRWVIRTRESSFFLLEMPLYQWPLWRNVGYVVGQRVKGFVFEAGKVIVIISIILWVLSNFGPGNRMQSLRAELDALEVAQPVPEGGGQAGADGNVESGNGELGNQELGNRESGNRESGNRESGNRESGNGGTGNGGSGNGESGKGESGNGESGNQESGNRESGNGESGNGGTGNMELGNGESGNRESGNGGSGKGESGNGELVNPETGNEGSVSNASGKGRAAILQQELLAASWAGQAGKFLEPAIAPLGFDWKIGIALVTSFAAREVFVGTMATMYSLGTENFEVSELRGRMVSEVNPATGKPVYSTATCYSLLIFYAFALQCMSTLAVTRRETRSWLWPVVQFVYMGALAYLGALGVFRWLS